MVADYYLNLEGVDGKIDGIERRNREDFYEVDFDDFEDEIPEMTQLDDVEEKL